VALGASGLLTFALLVVTGGYRMDRITSFVAAEDDPSGVGFHTLQLLVAFGSGGWGGSSGMLDEYSPVPGTRKRAAPVT